MPITVDAQRLEAEEASHVITVVESVLLPSSTEFDGAR